MATEFMVSAEFPSARNMAKFPIITGTAMNVYKVNLPSNRLRFQNNIGCYPLNVKWQTLKRSALIGLVHCTTISSLLSKQICVLRLLSRSL